MHKILGIGGRYLGERYRAIMDTGRVVVASEEPLNTLRKKVLYCSLEHFGECVPIAIVLGLVLGQIGDAVFHVLW